MATKKKMLQAAAGNAGGEALNVEDVFSTYLYEGTGGALTVNNGIDLSNEGGLVWTKNREDTRNHVLFDTERTNGEDYSLFTNTTDPESENSAFNFVPTSTGYTFNNNDDTNKSGFDFVGWTFRKAPKFFDVVTYTGNGNSSQTIPHNLGGEVGFIVVKKTSASGSWFGLHRNSGLIILNETGAAYSDSVTDGYFGDGTQVIRPTSTHFTIGSAGGLNDSGATLVAYLFAHNDGDGGFGPDGDADIIKCGSFTTDGSGNATVDLGFEPQFVINKTSSSADSWTIADSMRGFNAIGDQRLYANLSNAETTATTYRATSTGFTVNGGETSKDFIYIAIRRGTKVPESATEVFAPVTGSGVQSTGFPVDFLIGLNDRTNVQSYDPFVKTRLLGGASYLTTSSTAAEASGTDVGFDTMDGLTYSWPSSSAVAWYWKRAPGFFDAVAYTGTGGTTSQKAHNLGVVPEMIWVKTRSLTGREWVVWVDGFGTGQTNGTGTKEWLYLNTTASLQSTTLTGNTPWGGPHTATTFSTGSWSRVNDTGETYIAYLFASLDGVSKVGSYTGDGTNGRIIDCGFTSGARFVLIKLTNYSGGWFLWDSQRGIVAGNDPYLRLDNTNAENSTTDEIDPHSSGFIVNSTGGITNANGAHHIFYAIA